jgi:hypothetical protein
MTRKFYKSAISEDIGYYKWSDIRKAKPKIIYWVILPNGARRTDKYGVMYTSMIQCRNMKQANRIAKRYDAPYVERLIVCKLGRWPIGIYFRYPGKTQEELWVEWRKRPEIVINKKRNTGNKEADNESNV